MKVDGAMSGGLLAIQRGMQGLDRNAADIASARQMRGEASPVEPLVDSKLNRLQVEAGASVVKTVDETIGFLLDEMV